MFARTFRMGSARPTCLSVRRVAAIGILAALCGAVAFTPAAAKADTGDVVAAEALFRSGKDLLAEKDFLHACPKLAESFRLDAATGTLLALAICHEREGKLASAWGEYSDVAARSKAEGRTDREAAARSKVEELQSQLSTLTIVVPDAAQVPGLEVKRGGTTIGPAWFGTPVPVNGGTVSIDATAPGKKPRHGEITLAPSGDRESVTIDPLEDATDSAVVPVAPRAATATTAPTPAAPTPAAPTVAAAAPALAPIGPAPPVPADASKGGGMTAMQVTGLFAGAVGVVSLGLGAFFTAQAVDKNHDSQGECEAGTNTCTALGSKDRNDAMNDGNIATALMIGGGVLAGAGAALIIWGGRHEREESPAPRASLRFVPTGGPQAFGGLLQGSF